jgi:hypothetical protein
MDRYNRDLMVFLGRVDRRHVRVGLVVLSMILFVLGAGAPDTGGGWGGG